MLKLECTVHEESGENVMEQFSEKDLFKKIKYVGVYLRKSRTSGDTEKDLEKHKITLLNLCNQNNWKYVLYEEIESGENIFARPKMQRLLKDVEDDTYDAVCVMDIDRLGRGDMGDQDKIKKAFMKSQTLIITEKQIFDLSNDNDEFMIDIKGFFARREYKEIIKRLMRGKKVGARMGMWTNGIPPFPYDYEKYGDKVNEKGIVVNDEKNLTYQYIKNSFLLENMATNKIAWELNSKGISSPRGAKWSSTTIYRLLIDETHLGKIITNKTTGIAHLKKKKEDSKPFKILPQSEWVIVENCHEPVKTLEEHEKILIKLKSHTNIVKRSQINIYPLTGLLKCGICNHGMVLLRRENRLNPESIKPCWFRDEIGNKCKNRGGQTKLIYELTNKQILAYEESLKSKISEKDKTLNGLLTQKIKENSNLINAKEKSLERILEAYENGVYTLEKFKERKNKAQKEIDKIKEDSRVLELQIKYLNKETNEEKLDKIQNFKNKINLDLSSKELNELYRSIIDSIIWTREGNNINIKVNFR